MTIRKMCASSSLTTATALALLVAIPGFAEAQVTVLGPAPADRLSTSVLYADLDLTSAADIAELHVRVRGAVQQVCAPHDQRHTFVEYGACRSYARAGADPQMKQAVARAQQLASSGASSIAPVAILIAAPRN